MIATATHGDRTIDDTTCYYVVSDSDEWTTTTTCSSKYSGTADSASFIYLNSVYYVCSNPPINIDYFLKRPIYDFGSWYFIRVRQEAMYRLLIAGMMNIYGATLFRRTAFSKSGFVGRSARRKRN